MSLGKILLNPTNLLLLDEPTNHLDIESCDSMIVALDEFPGAVVIVTHSEMFLHHLANRLIIFNEDKVFVFEGSYQEFLDKIGWEPEIKKTKKEKKPEKNEQDMEALTAVYNKQRKALLVKIEKIEKDIDQTETLLEAANMELAQAYEKKAAGPKLQELQSKSGEYQALIDGKDLELEKLIAELDVLDKKKP